ncbi:glycosyltransferase family 2 protein, partial [Stutzerimonas zhaodongensis]|uniref:glycosyltransferase family 2 protein n=1 Tax=Stutzerimonas zhaodongensis TaxID=1176257 RepID=UPI0021025092
MMKSKILVFIPAYRCENQIIRVINQFDDRVQALVDTVMVVDNRSPDSTLEKAIECGRSVLHNCNFIAWINDDNYGLGGSHKAAFRYAIEHGFDHLVVLHGDDQADIRDLIPLLEEGVHLDVDCLLGARFMRGSQLKGYSWFRTYGNRLYNALFSAVALRAIYDLGSGLNIYRLVGYRDFYYKSFPDDLTFNYVMLMASYHRKQIVRFFPITWREEDQISNVKLFRQAS